MWIIRPAILILFVHLLTDTDGSTDWTYSGDHGPEKWSGICQTGKEQSPIDVVTENAIKKDLGDLKFVEYECQCSGTVINNGHTIQVKLQSQLPLQLKSEYLASNYTLEQLHFHWDAEHTVDGHRYPLEMHLVHYDERFDDVAAASQERNGVAVVATFFEVNSEDNQALNPILKGIEQVSAWVGSSSTSLRDKLRPRTLLPEGQASYYTYEGSLTTPKCQEAVVWFVMTKPVAISENQLRIFHNVSSAEGTLKFNYRPIQDLGDREVYHHLPGYSAARSNFSVHVYLALLCTLLVRLS